MIREQLVLAVAFLEPLGKINDFEKSLVLRDFNEFTVETYNAIDRYKTSEEKIRFLNWFESTIITPNITRLSSIQGSSEPEREYYKFALKKYLDAKGVIDTLMEQLFPKAKVLYRYFSNIPAINKFIELLHTCRLLDENGNLKGRKTLQLIEVLRIACENGLTKEDYFTLDKVELVQIIAEISGIYGIPLEIKDTRKTIKKQLAKRDIETYNRAKQRFLDFTPD